MGNYEPALGQTLEHIHRPFMNTVVYAGTIALDTQSAVMHKTTTVNATGNATINANTAGYAGQNIYVLVVNDGTSGKTITFGTNFMPSGTVVGTTSKGAVLEFLSDGTSWWEVSRTLLL